MTIEYSSAFLAHRCALALPHRVGLLHFRMWAEIILCCRIAVVIFAAISICILLTFPGPNEVDENESGDSSHPLPSSRAAYSAFATSTLASLLSVVSMLWQHLASVAATTTAEDMAFGTLESNIGINAMVMGWVGVAAFVMVSIGLWMMILSFLLLDIMIVF